MYSRFFLFDRNDRLLFPSILFMLGNFRSMITFILSSFTNENDLYLAFVDEIDLIIELNSIPICKKELGE